MVISSNWTFASKFDEIRVGVISWNGGKTEIVNVLFGDVLIGSLSSSGGNLLTGKRMFEVSNTSIYEKKHKYQNNTQWGYSYVLGFEQL